MAHNLYRETMAFTGAKPWHFDITKSIELTETFTAEQAIEAAHLGYEVRKEQLFRKAMNQSGLPVHKPVNSWATINGDTEDVLGIVGEAYCPLQNKEAFTFFDELLGEAGARYCTAGAIGKGERIWLLVETPNSFSPVPGDPVDQYMLLCNSHDGSTAITVRFTGIRVVCQNTLNMALASKAGRHQVSLKHTSRVADRLKIASQILKGNAEYFARIEDAYSRLAHTKIDDLWIDQYINHLFGEELATPEGAARTIRARKVDTFMDHLHHGKGAGMEGVRGTAWGALNAAVEYADFSFPLRSSSDRTNSILFGSAFDFKQKAQDFAMVLTG